MESGGEEGGGRGWTILLSKMLSISKISFVDLGSGEWGGGWGRGWTILLSKMLSISEISFVDLGSGEWGRGRGGKGVDDSFV